MNGNTVAFILAIIGGVLPATVWLWFWLKEDRAHPEPKVLLFLSFLAGMIAVPFVLPFEKFTFSNFSSFWFIASIGFFEESFKYLAAYFIALRTKAFDEPIDAIIYMITAALGFAAAENALFILNPLLSHNIVDGIITNNLRFVGASLLHTLASSTVGIFIAFAFYRNKSAKIIYTVIGLFFGIALHTCFNLFIVDASGAQTVIVFSAVWFCIIVLLYLFEKVKNIHGNNGLV